MDSWTSSPEAARLLASCAASPPRRRLFVYRFEEAEPRFVGRRVRRLSRLYRAAQPRLDSEAWRAWLGDDPQSAIARAIDNRRRAATGPPAMTEPADRLMQRHDRLVAAWCEDLASREFRLDGATPRTRAALAACRQQAKLPTCSIVRRNGHLAGWTASEKNDM